MAVGYRQFAAACPRVLGVYHQKRGHLQSRQEATGYIKRLCQVMRAICTRRPALVFTKTHIHLLLCPASPYVPLIALSILYNRTILLSSYNTQSNP